MGAKFDNVYSFLPIRVENGIIEVKDFLGKIHTGKLPAEFEFDWDRSEYAEDLFINVVSGDKRLVCRYDMTYSVIRNSTMELLDIGAYEFDESQFNREYREVGYKRNLKRVEALLYDDKTNLVFSTVSDKFSADKVYKAKTKIDNVNLTMSIGLAREPSYVPIIDIYIYKWGGFLKWRDYLEEIPRIL